MGRFHDDTTTRSVVHKINSRFAAGDPLTEMTALHKQFRLFTATHRLKETSALLGIVPDHPGERKAWGDYLDNVLKSYESDMKGVDGHERIVKAYADNFNRTHPLPVHTKLHPITTDKRVIVTEDRPDPLAPVDHVVNSIPVQPRMQRAGEAAPARIAPQRRAAQDPSERDK